jgi:hypothetical protein
MRSASLCLFTVVCSLSCSQKAHCKTTDSFACQAHATPAESDAQGLFKRAGTKDPVTVKVTFTNSDTDCTGVPLEINVMNGQLVHVTIKADGFDCVTTQTRAAAPSAITPTDIIALISKGLTVGFDGGHGATPTPKDFYLDSGRNVALTASISCTNSKRTLKQDIKVTYQNPPPVAVSAGVLIGTSHIRSYGISTAQTGITGGVATTQNAVAVTGSPTVQFIPFSYFNLYWCGTRKLNFNGQLGIGVNPNLSSPRVEFFASPLALAWHDLYLSPGFHLGQHENLSGGFTVGENTASSLSKIPIHWDYYTGFGFSLSYNLKPLVKGGSSPPASAKK